MAIISQNAHHRHRMLKYYRSHGASKTAIRYEVSRKTVYKWVGRYDGTLSSLRDQSRRPHTSPKAHNDSELRLIRRVLKRLMVVKATHKTLFEESLDEMDIIYKRIRIATPRHNGKVEQQHRTDQMRFYDNLQMFSLADGRRQLAAYQAQANNHIKTCLNMKSPNHVLNDFLYLF